MTKNKGEKKRKKNSKRGQTVGLQYVPQEERKHANRKDVKKPDNSKVN